MTFPGHKDSTKNELDPWPVVLACLFDLDSYEIPGIIDTSGMVVDWALTQRDDYSDKYRKLAYRPRISRAYEALGQDDRLRVAYILCEELTRRSLADKLTTDLQRIGWRIDGGTLVPATKSVRELFFPRGTQHGAYVRIREIIRCARQSLRVIDPYLDGTVFTILGDIHGSLTIEFLGVKFPADFSHETAKFRQQHPDVQIETRQSRDFHDRFIVIDDSACWHIGCSIKDAGDRAFMLSAIEDFRNTQALLDTLRRTWANATHLA